jgi:hypothetical protein
VGYLGRGEWQRAKKVEKLYVTRTKKARARSDGFSTTGTWIRDRIRIRRWKQSNPDDLQRDEKKQVEKGQGNSFLRELIKGKFQLRGGFDFRFRPPNAEEEGGGARRV